jgi:branched-chain amino acid transport system permease protein
VPLYYLCLFLLVVSAYVFWRLDASRPGKTFRAIAQNARLAESLGIYEMKHKVQAFAIACFFTGVAGSFYAHYLNMLTPAMFTIEQSIWIFLCAILGGVQSIVFGPLLGAFVMTIVSNLLRSYGSFEPMVVGLMLSVTCLYFPGGLIFIGPRIAKRLREQTT